MEANTQDFKGFWKRAEGKFGIAVAGGLCLVVFAFLWQYHQKLFDMARDTTMAAVMITALIAFLAMVTSEDFRRNVSLVYKILMLKMTNAIIRNGYIEVMEDKIQEAKKIRTKIEENLDEFRAQIDGLKQLINDNAGKIKLAMQFAGEANKQLKSLTADQSETAEARAKRKALIMNSRSAMRKEQSNKSYQDLLALAERVYRILLKAKDSADILIEDKEADLQERKTRDKVSRSTLSLLQKVRHLKGQLEDNFLYDKAAEAEQAKFAEALGTLNNFTEVSGDFLAKSDLANGLFESEALKRLEAMERDAGSGLLDDIVTRDGGVQSRSSETEASQIRPTGTGKYRGLFN